MSAPAVLIALPLLAGVVAGGLSGSGSRAALIVLGVVWLVLLISLWMRRDAVAVAATVAGCLASGVSLGAGAARAAASPSLLTWFHESASRDGPVGLTAVLREDAGSSAAGVAAIADAVDVDGRTVTGGVRISVGGALSGSLRQDWRAGRTISLTVLLREPLDYRDPGVASDRERLTRQGIVLLGSVKSAALTRVVARGSWLSESAGALRARVRAATATAVGSWDARSGGVVTAILIGDRGGLDAEDERRLQEAGTYHVIAISGGNIALLTALLVALGRAARLPARGTAAGSIALLAFYGYAAGLAPSVLRATLAGMVYLAARALDHRGTALNALAVAGACAAVAAPLTVLDPGFVLSFGATLAIVTTAARVMPVLSRERGAGPVRVWGRRLLAGIAALGAATICAEIALAPIGARLFGRISLAGLVLNFIAIPLMSIIQVAGLAAVGVTMISAAAARAFGWIAYRGTTALVQSASLVDLAPWLVIDSPPPAMWLIGSWYGGWVVVLRGRRRAIRAVALATVVSSAILILRAAPATSASRVPPPPDGWTRVAFLDVGQGDAALVWPAGALPLLVDAGGVPGSAFDLGRRVTLPASWAFGVRKLGALVLTHGDPDHIGGAPALLRALSPVEVWDGVPVPRHEPLRRLRAAAAAARIPWSERRAGQVFRAGAVTIAVANPPEPDWERPKVRNDDSIVLDVRVGDVSLLLTGDITAAVEREVITGFSPPPITIIKAPHHGSAGSSSQAFVAATRPAAVIFSAGRRNPFGHPAVPIVERYRAAGAHVFSTADDGAVVVDTDGKTVVIWTWMGRREVLSSRPTARHKDH